MRLFPKMNRVRQKTVAHCGPAVVEMLASYLNEKVDQDKLVAKTGVSPAWFKRSGLTVRELKRAVNELFPELTFWYKKNSSIGDISRIVNVYKHPVGIEWQGVFNYTSSVFDPKYGEEDDDPGHYSVVVGINTSNSKNGFVKIADPERHYFRRSRKFLIPFFKKRWWDVNEIKVGKSKKIRKVKDNEMMFLITKKGVDFPKKLGMIK